MGLLGAGAANAAITVNETIEGGWFNPAAAGRGVLFDYIKSGTDRGVLFGATFIYGANGQQIWLTFQPELLEGEFSATGFPVLRFTGGSFGDPAAAPTSVAFGTGALTVNNCSSMTLTLTPAPAENLPPTTYELQRLGAAPPDCVWTRSFTACPAGTTAAAGVPRTCILNGNYTNQTLRLTNETTWVLEGRVEVGGDNAAAATIEIEPGTRITGSGDTFDHLYVNRGSRINAVGTPRAPIVFTSPNDGVRSASQAAPKDWGGVVIAGNAPVNCPGGQCTPEFAPGKSYGGSNAADSSGVFKYVQIRYSGYIYQTDREINALTLLGVGTGTEIDYVQAYRGGDDGVEFFGGTANVKHFVVTEGGDDGIDWDEGWSGNLQFALVQNGSGFGEDHGYEGANNPNNFDASPRAVPQISNVTLIGNSRGRDGMNLKEGTGGKFYNTAIAGWARSCLTIQDSATFTAAGFPVTSASNLTIRNSLVNCTTNFRTSPSSGQSAPFTTEAWYNSQPGNLAADPQFVSVFLPGPASPLLNGGSPVSDDAFFVPVTYIGAFRDQNDRWYSGWTYGIAQ
jgi:hypothetical protein